MMTPMSTTVTLADYHDAVHAQLVVDLLNAYATDPMGGATPLPDDVRERLVPAMAATPGAFSVLCFVDDEPAGLVNCFMGFSTFKAKPLVNIHDVVVVPGHRGKGLTRQMLNEVERVARERGCCKLTLEVLTGNDVAQRAYESFGFEGFELDPEKGRAMFWEKPL